MRTGLYIPADCRTTDHLPSKVATSTPDITVAPLCSAISAPRITISATPVFIHWVSFKFRCDDEDEFLQEFYEVTGLENSFGNVSNTTLKTYFCESGITITSNNSMLLDFYGDEKLLIITGRDCELIDNWHGPYELMKAQRDVSIKRIDLSIDVNTGLALSDIITAYRRGRFSVKGKQNPEKTQIGDFVKDDGLARTVLFGKRTSAKVLRIYEIGRKLKTASQQEIRLELELKSLKCTIPLDAIIDPTPYFRGAYPFLKKFGFGQTKRTITSEFSSIKNYQSQVEHCKTSYGKLINLMLDIEPNAEAVIALLKRVGYPEGLMLDQLKPISEIASSTLHGSINMEALSANGVPNKAVSLDERSHYFDDVISVDEAPNYLNITKLQFNQILKRLDHINISAHEGAFYRYQLDYIMNHSLVRLDVELEQYTTQALQERVNENTRILA